MVAFMLFLTLFVPVCPVIAPPTETPHTTHLPVKRREIACTAFRPDGRQIAVGTRHQVLLLDTATAKTLWTSGAFPGDITSVQFSPNGATLAVGGGKPGREGTVQLWNVASVTGRGVRAARAQPLTLSGPDDSINSLAFSPNGRLLAAASYDHDVYVWNVGRAKSKIGSPRILKDHTDAVYSVAFSPDSRLLASAAGDRTVKVWDAATGQRVYTLSQSTAEVYAVAFRPDGKQIAAGGADKALRLWNVTASAGTPAKSAFAHQGAVLQVVYTRDGASLITSGEDDVVKQWDAATMAEKRVYPKQPDWPVGIALSPDGRLLAVGDHNGALSLFDTRAGTLVRKLMPGSPIAQNAIRRATVTTAALPASSLLRRNRRAFCRLRPTEKADAPPDAANAKSAGKARPTGGPTLFTASLSGISPLGTPRGKTVRFTLNGSRIGDANAVFFDDPAIAGKIVTPRSANADQLLVDAEVGPQARIGVHRCFVQTPHGATGSVHFAVGAWPEVAQAEPNDTPAKAQPLSFPCTVTGAMDQPGDADCFRFDAKAGQEIVFQVLAQPLGSRLQPVLTVLDSEGKTVAESKPAFGQSDALLGVRLARAGSYVVQLQDFQGGGGKEMAYRLNVGEFPVVTAVFPLGIQKGTVTEVRVKGFNLDGKTTVRFQAPPVSSPLRSVDLSLETSRGPLLATRSLALSAAPESVRSAGNDSFARAQAVPVPVMVNGALWDGQGTASGLSHFYRFPARKGRPLMVDVLARRLGSPLDSEIAILDSKGNPVERAVVRVLAQTEITFSDRDSESGGFRLTGWEDILHINDYVMIGREIIQVYDLPKGPDADVGFRSFRGQRLTYFGTTPEYHTVGTPVYKVEVHPPGTIFSPNGYPLTRLTYRNDDGGGLYGKDSHLEFTAPEDGEYVVQIADTRGLQGEDFAYCLHIHPANPDFRLSMNPAQFNLPRGSGVPVTVECERYDGFDGPIEVKLEGLPAGFTATSTVIESHEFAATLLLSCSKDAVTPTLPVPSPIRLVGRAVADGKEIIRTVEPDNGVRLLTVLTDPDIRLTTDRTQIVLHPGEETRVEAQVDRLGKFGKRIPLDVRNLPYGVRVQYVGLNGILVTEEQDAREFVLYCEPWVQPQTRPIYVIADIEGGTPTTAPPLTLQIE